MPVITVSRQFGSGGSEVARRVADRLGWMLIDNEFVDLVAQRAGLPPEEVQRLEERVAGLVERLARALAMSSPEVFVAAGQVPATDPAAEADLARVTEAVINEAVQHDNVVLVGRGAQAYLAERTDTLHIYVVAPRDVRIRRAMERLKVDRKEAERTVDEMDNGRRQYVRTHYGRKWDDAANYHLVINTDAFSYDETTELILEAVRRRAVGR